MFLSPSVESQSGLHYSSLSKVLIMWLKWFQGLKGSDIPEGGHAVRQAYIAGCWSVGQNNRAGDV